MVLKGVLREAGLPAVLAQLADGGSSGCLHVKDEVGEQAKIFLRTGRVYSVVSPGRTPQLGARLVSSGDLAPEALADAQQAQRTELQGWRLGELLVHLGYVEHPVVEAFVQEHLRAALADLLLWDEGTWRFRVNERTREDVAEPVAVSELLAEVERRRESWEAIRALVPGGASVPVLASAGPSEGEMVVDPDAWSLLCKVDGLRTVAELARDGGFTLYEAAGVVATLVTAGLVEVLPPTPVEVPDPVEAPEPALTEPQPAVDVTSVATTLLTALAPTLPPEAEPEDVEGSLHRVSSELSAMLGPGRADEGIFAAVVKPPLPPAEPDPDELRRAEEREAARRRDAARRPADAAELAAAQAELEAARVAALALATPADPAVDLASSSREDADSERADAAQEAAAAERLAAERLETERLETERVEAERLDAERVAQEEAEAEQAAREVLQAEQLIPTQATSSDEAADAAAARAELSAAADHVPEPVEAAEPEPAPAPDPAPVWAEQDTDTASLLRELSSLGLDDDEAEDQGAHTSQRLPVGAYQSRQKKKGLFGRG